MNTFEENLSYLLREWCWGKAWENMGRPWLSSCENSGIERREYFDKSGGEKHNLSYQRVRVARSEWFPESVYDLIIISGNDKNFLWAASENNDHIIISEWDRGSRERVSVEVSDFTGEDMAMLDEEAGLLRLVYPWAEEATRIISEGLRQCSKC